MYCSRPGSSIHGIFQARLLELGSHSILRGIFPTKGLNPGFLHRGQILYCLSHQGCPTDRIMPPQRSSHSSPQNLWQCYLTWPRDFADGIKNLEMRNLEILLPDQDGLCVLKINVYTRRRQGGQSQKKRCYDRSRGLKMEEETKKTGKNKFSPRAPIRRAALQTQFRLLGSIL